MTKTKLLGGLFLWAMLIAIIFVVPLIPLISNKTIEAPFLLPTGPDRAMVFFGYSACGDICPTTMMMLSNTLESSKSQQDWPAVIFVDIDTSSNARQASLYAKQFNQHFSGYFPAPTELTRLSDYFGLNFQQTGSLISHRGRTYLLQRQDGVWYLKKAYNPQGFIAELLKNELL